ILGDIRDGIMIDKLTKGQEIVFHLASLISIPYSYQAPQAYVDTNVHGALNVAQACLNHGVQKLIHTSTSEVYGSARYVPIDEKHPLQGQSPYSASKISADMIVQSFYSAFELPLTTLRPFNTYGPRQSLRAVIPTIISQMLARVPVIHLGDLMPTRDFNFVSDTVEAFMSIGRFKGSEVIGETFNAGSGREISIGALVEILKELTSYEGDVTTDDQRVRPKNSEVERLLCDAGKIERIVGWKSKVSLEDGLKETISWIKSRSEYLKTSQSYYR
ncbi:MAG: NAD-dependent epimerase/dehydratase family protein, partial [Proteobacteria bacterium]